MVVECVHHGCLWSFRNLHANALIKTNNDIYNSLSKYGYTMLENVSIKCKIMMNLISFQVWHSCNWIAALPARTHPPPWKPSSTGMALTTPLSTRTWWSFYPNDIFRTMNDDSSFLNEWKLYRQIPINMIECISIIDSMDSFIIRLAWKNISSQ